MKNNGYLPLEINQVGYGFETADGCSYDNCGHYGKKDAELKAMAKFFVLAINSHAALLSALQDLAAVGNNAQYGETSGLREALNRAEKVIRQVEGGK